MSSYRRGRDDTWAPTSIIGVAAMSDAQLADWRRRLIVDVRFDSDLRETLDEVEDEIARRRADDRAEGRNG